MGNTYRAHIFKERQVGPREEVKIKLFNLDGSPLVIGEAPDPDGEVSPVMLFKGLWDASENYKAYDVVQYNPGDGLHTYIFNEDHNAGLPTILDVNGHPIAKLWDPLVNQVDLVLGPQSYVGSGGMAAGIYDVFAIKVNVKGLISLRAADTVGLTQDLGAGFWHLKPDNTWEALTTDDDGSGGGKPWIQYTPPDSHVMPGTYAYYISKYSTGYVDANAYGTTRVTLGVNNTAVIGSFADFPLAKATRLG